MIIVMTKNIFLNSLLILLWRIMIVILFFGFFFFILASLEAIVFFTVAIIFIVIINILVYPFTKTRSARLYLENVSITIFILSLLLIGLRYIYPPIMVKKDSLNLGKIDIKGNICWEGRINRTRHPCFDLTLHTNTKVFSLPIDSPKINEKETCDYDATLCAKTYSSCYKDLDNLIKKQEQAIFYYSRIFGTIKAIKRDDGSIICEARDHFYE
jgi:hypothetical protein